MNKFRIPAIILLVFFLILFLRGRTTHERFNSVRWKTADLDDEKNWTMRWDMMNGLRNTHNLVRLTKSQVIALLCCPDGESIKEFRYNLGYSKHGINTGTLTITFDNAKVQAIRVLQG